MKKLKVLVACEESQAVTKEFRRLGHEAYSCDILPCSGGHPEWHIQNNVLNIIDQPWDLIIAHPVCTYLANSGVRWLYVDGEKNYPRWESLRLAVEFFNEFKNNNCNHVCIENPIPHGYALNGFKWRGEFINGIGKYSQTIQPWEFGHTTSKRTCLWLKGLPKLVPTQIIKKEDRTQEIWLCPPGPNRQKIRSKTFPGIAKAMAEQWSEYLLNQ